jgi:hypothetical protein
VRLLHLLRRLPLHRAGDAELGALVAVLQVQRYHRLSAQLLKNSQSNLLSCLSSNNKFSI